MNYNNKLDKYKEKINNLLLNKIGGASKKDRPSPSESATLFEINTKKVGNDGNTWVIVENKNHVKKWKLKTSNEMTLEGLYPTKPIIQKNNWNDLVEIIENLVNIENA